MTRTILQTILFCAALIFALATTAAADAPADGFVRGNARYAAGDFAGAAAAYEDQVRGGAWTANLFYNLADACYRQGSRGRAILNYQRALILDPAHAEAAANLAFLRGQKPVAPPPRAGWETGLLPCLTAAAGWLAVAGLGAAAMRRRGRNLGLAVGAVGVVVCVAGVLTIRSHNADAGNATRAVVVADSAPALYAPADNAKVITTLIAGGEVQVLSDQGAWIYALLGDGTRAWVAADKIERVVPSR